MLKQKHVLLVDDSRDQNWLNATRLKALGCAVSITTSLDEAVKAAQEDPPDLMLVDYCLEGATGIDVIRTVKATLPTQPLCAIVTGQSVDLVEMDNACFNVDRVFQKPISAPQLQELVQACKDGG